MAMEALISVVPEIDPEIADMIPPPSREEEAGLEADLLAAGGARGPLDVWLNQEDGRYTLLDGHNRKRLCEKHGLPYACRVEPRVKTREDALAFVTSETVNRRNITPLARAILIGRQYNREKAPGARTDLQTGTRSHAAERLGRRYGISARSVELCGRAAKALNVIRSSLSLDAAQSILTGEVKVTREEVVELADLAEPETMRAVWDEWLRSGKAGRAKLIAKHRTGRKIGSKAAPRSATARYRLPDLVSSIALHWDSSACARAAVTMDRKDLQVIDRHLARAVRNLLQIAGARELPIRGVVEEWLARSDGGSAGEEVRRVFAETAEDASEPAQGAAREDHPAEQPEAASGVPGVDLEAVRQRMRAALDGGTTMAALAREIGISPQSSRNILAGSEPYAKTRVTLADWMAES